MAHLGELRKVLIRCILSLSIVSVVSFLFADFLLKVLLLPYQSLASLGATPPPLLTLQPAEGFLLSMKLALLAGVILSFPLLAYQVWHFISEGLYPREKRLFVPALYVGTGLFIIGALFAFYLVVPQALRFFWNYNLSLGVTPSWTITYYLNFVLMFLLAFGVAFEMPMVVVLVNQLGLITKDSLSAKRPYVIVAIFLVAGFLTPPDVLSQLALAFPMWGLFEVSLWFTK